MLGVVLGAFAELEKDLVGIDELLEGGSGDGGDTRCGEIVRVALEGDFLVGRSDLVSRTVAVEAEDLVVAPLLRLRRSHGNGNSNGSGSGSGSGDLLGFVVS